MKTISLKSLRVVLILLCITLPICSCVAPVDTDLFFNNEYVDRLVEGGQSGGIYDGTFTYIVDTSEIKGSITDASVLITHVLDNETREDSLKDGGGWNNSVKLRSGNYRVDFVFKVDTVKREFRHTLQVFQNMDSKFEYKFTDDDLTIIGDAAADVSYIHPADRVIDVLVKVPSWSGGTGTLNDPIIYSSAVSPEKLEFIVQDKPLISGFNKWVINGVEWGDVHLDSILTKSTAPYQLKFYWRSAADGLYYEGRFYVDKPANKIIGTELYIKYN